MEKVHLKETLFHGTPAFPVAIYNNKFDKQYTLLAHLHYHNEFELLVATKGTLSVQIEENSYQLSEGEGLFINSGLLHIITANADEDHGFIAIVFDFTIICNEYDSAFGKYIHPLMNGTLKVPVRLTTELCSFVHSICSIYESSSFGFELYIKQSLIQIFYLLVRNSMTTTLPIQNTKSIMIKNVLDYIEKKYSEQISLQDMADYAHISKEYLCRIFRAMSDSSPIEYLNRYRIRQSTKLLINTNREISDISTSCGFNNSSYFNKLFLRHIGCTPTEYRKNHTQRVQPVLPDVSIHLNKNCSARCPVSTS